MSEQLNPANASQWAGLLAHLPTVQSSLNTALGNLQKLGPYVQQYHPELLSQYQGLITQAAQDQSQLTQLNQVAAQVQPWLQALQNAGVAVAIANPFEPVILAGEAISTSIANGILNLFGFSPAQQPLQGLGEIPLVIVAIGIVAATAIVVNITNHIAQYIDMATRLNALYRQEQAGASPQAAADIVTQTMGQPSQMSNSLFPDIFPSTIGGIQTTYLLAGLAAVIILPALFHMMEKNK